MATRFDVARAISRRLTENEKLLWCDRPCEDTHLSASALYRIFVGIIWCAGNLFMLFNFYVKTVGVGKILCYIMFAVFFSYGLYVIYSSFAQKGRRSNPAVYAITDKRVIFAKVSPDGSIKELEAIPLDRVEKDELISGKKGIGTITFWSVEDNQRFRKNDWAFYDIKRCKKVWNILNRAKNEK